MVGRERAKAAALCQATPSCQPASSQQAAFELVQTATSVQHPPSALDRFIARKRAGKGQTSVGQTSAPLQPVASPQGPSLGKAPTALERVNARHTAHVGAKALPSQHQALPAQAAAGAKHYTLYSDRVLDADASQHSQDTVLSQWHLIRKDTVPVALEQHTNSRQASALERTNAKLQARRDTRFLRPEATLTRLPDHQTTLDSLPSSTAARIGTFSQAAQVVDLPQQSTGPQMHATGVGRMRCDEISQRQQRHPAAAGPRHDLDSHHVLLSHKLKPRVGVKATAVLTDASNGVSSSGHGQLRSDSVIYPCLLDVSRDNDRMKPSGDKASTKQRKRMYQDIESDRPVSVADRLGIATSSKKLRQISQRCDTGCVQIVQDLGVFSRLGRQPIVI